MIYKIFSSLNTWQKQIMIYKIFSVNTRQKQIMIYKIFSDNTWQKQIMIYKIFSVNTWQKQIMIYKIFSENTWQKQIMIYKIFSSLNTWQNGQIKQILKIFLLFTCSFIGGGNWRKPQSCHWQTLSHNVVLSTFCHERCWNLQC
jgi:hypothetical protein